jgi:adenine-specific DNA glycosylase
MGHAIPGVEGVYDRHRYDDEKAHALLEAAVAPEDFYTFHIGLIKHGRRTCDAQRPRCPECVLVDVCPSAVKFHPALRVTKPAGMRRVPGSDRRKPVPKS